MAALPPQLTSVAALHAYLGVGAGEARFLSRYAHHRYRAVNIPKRRGGFRNLLVPEDRLKFLQRKMLELLEPRYKPRPAAHGFVVGRSAITNANSHQARPYLLNLDLENYFGNITRNRVHGMLQAIGFAPEVARAICHICIVNNQLPQGAPTSPLLANMVSFRLDKDLTQFSKANRIRYTRYADDITFSSYVRPVALFSEPLQEAGALSVEGLSKELRLIISSNNFTINPVKTRYADRKSRKEVTGLIVNEFTNVRRTFIRDLRASLYKIDKLGLSAAQTSYNEKYGSDALLKDVLRGRLEWLAQVRSRSFYTYRTLAQRYNKHFPDNPAPIDPTNEEVAKSAIFVIEHFDGDGAQGTAFLLDGVGLVTAFHTLDGMVSEWADLYRPHEPTKKFRAKVGGKFCKHRDIALLEHDIPAEDQASLRPATGAEHVKSSIIALGYPEFASGDGLSERTGKIVGRSTKSAVRYVEVDAILGDGLSGGPIVNDRYEVIALTHKGGLLESKQLGVDIVEITKVAEA